MWTTWQPATCRPDHCFCEAIHSAAVAQPANTWSSLGFVIVGLLIAHGRMRDDGNPMARYRRIYGYALVLIGLGSAFYHASLTFVGQLMDVSGMYILITFALLYSLNRLYKGSRVSFILAYLGTNILLFVLQTTLPGMRRYVFGVLVVAVLATEIRRRTTHISIDGKWLLRAAVVMAAAFSIWVLDITRTFCDPYSIVQGHAIWHLLGAAAAYCLYRYYGSETAT
jgi:hypothetical protein